MLKNINSIVRIFPDYEDKIDFLFQTDEDFRDLCKDYLLCASNVLEMKTEISNFSAQTREYEDLQRNLEQEILQMITRKE
ncbi:hypothetical protein K8352_16255 [Flavobacteriaceae bacterium F89]|uniref:Uncharacterized protein n=1 Tax=Cerina litoralis TaxID=2874477 RepID=A0AAE3JPN8_9FLAO|nr:hypothetical protein [Cerina litoralis]MCG2462315.1 hypothetical protein [Cerina litoralis]